MNWLFLALISAFLSAAAAITQKKILGRMTALEFSFVVSIVIAGMSSVIPLFVDVGALNGPTLVILLGKSILAGCAFLLVMTALEHNQISLALPILGVTPAVTALFAFLVLGESLSAGEWVGVGLIVIGAYLLEVQSGQRMLQPFRKLVTSRNHLALFAAVGLFAVSSVADRALLGGMGVDPSAVFFYQHLVYCVMFGGILLALRVSFGNVLRRGFDQGLLIGLVALLTVGYRFTQLEATQLAPVALVLAVKRTSIVYASLLGGTIFADERLAARIIGCVIIVSAGFLIVQNVP
jgi:drug/metabolite transporter (DMT)-like permease